MLRYAVAAEINICIEFKSATYFIWMFIYMNEKQFLYSRGF